MLRPPLLPSGRPALWSRTGARTALATLVLFAGSAAAQVPFPAGTYTRTITEADRPPTPPLVGTWHVRLGADGRYDVTRGGQLAVTGRYTVAADTLTLTDDGGPLAGRGDEATGRYRWARDSAGLALRVVADRDVGRRFIMGGGALRRLTSTDSARSEAPAAATTTYAGPIIDVHLHGYGPELVGTPPNPITGRPNPVRSAAEHRRATLAAMAEHGVVLGMVSVPPGPVEENAVWAAEGNGRIWPGVSGFSDVSRRPLPSVDALRRAHRGGTLKLIGEVGAQYSGMALDDPRLEPYYALAEELDVPVGVHTGGSFPGTAFTGARTFRMRYGNPLALEDVLVRHPKLRVYLMHAGWPYRTETIALLSQYPQVSADLAVLDWALPRAEFHDYLQALTRAGLGDRLMFGSDQMLWPDAIGLAVAGVASAPFLSAAEKRAIFFDNAARFFRLDSAQVRALTAAATANARTAAAPPR